MALSENEKKLAENICGKVLVSKETIGSRDLSIIFDVNEYGIIKDGFKNMLYSCPRSEDIYDYSYENIDYILDDIKNDFIPQKNYLEDNYGSKRVVLFTNGSISIVLKTESNKLSVLDNKEISKYYRVSKKLPDNLSENTKVLLEKYSSNIDNVLQGIKEQLGYTKEDSIVGARNRYAHYLAEQKSTLSNNAEDASKKLDVIECYYNKLKQNFTAEELAKEEKELSKAYNQELFQVLNDNQSRELNNENILKDEKNRVDTNNKDLPSYEALKNKLLFKVSGVDTFVKISFVDKNGIIETNGSKNFPMSTRTFNKNYISLDKYHVFEDEFKQENFEGNVYKKSRILGKCVRLFKNDNYSLVMNFINSNLNNYYFTIEENEKFEKSSKKIKDKNYKYIIKEYSSINKIVAEINTQIDSNYSGNVKESLIDKTASILAREKGYSDFISDSQYALSLEKDLLNNFTVEYMKENKFSKEDVDNFYVSVEEELKQHKENKERRDIDREDNRKLNEIQHEENIEKAVLKALVTLGIESPKENEEKEVEEKKVNNFDYNLNFIQAKSVKKSHREPLALNDTVINIIFKLSEGNPGAINVISKILNNNMVENMSEDEKEGQKFKNLMTLLSLDDMNIRGSQIWILFKDVNGLNMDNPEIVKDKKFLDVIEKINNRDKKLVEALNNECQKLRMTDKAVISGASDIMSNGKDASSLYFEYENEDENE